MHNVFVLLWKDLLMRRNHYVATTLHVVIPISFIIFFNVVIPKIRQEVNRDPVDLERPRTNHCTTIHSLHENIVYEPSTLFLDKLMSQATCLAGYKRISVKSGSLENNNTIFSLGVRFNLSNRTQEIPDVLNYTIYPSDNFWIGVHTLWRYSVFGIPKYSVPKVRNVLELQRAIDVSYLHMKNVTVPQINTLNTDFFERSPRLYYLLVHITLYMAFALMVSPIVSSVIQEKFTGAKELMLMMGVKKWELWTAKFIDSYFFLVISVLGMVLFLYVPLKESSNTLRIPPAILIFVILYGFCSVIISLFFVTCFFDKANIAVYVTKIVWALSYIFNNLISGYFELPQFIKYLTCLFPNIALMNGISVLLDYDFFGKDVKLTEQLSGKDDYLSLLEVLVIMTIDIGLYAVLTWYLEQVMPSKFGVTKPYGFCFKKSYWFPDKVNTSSDSVCMSNMPRADGFEPVPENLERGICIQNVTKIYKSLDKGVLTAVDDVSINFYRSEISALLGHNGAGKTTIFSMITGLTSPTSGKVMIDGYDLAQNTDEARRSLGLCPQKDMLFDDLTSLQILKFYGVIKGLSFKAAETEAKDLIVKLKLKPVQNTRTCHLSGGQKRKVSLAIALIGGSEVLLLDEPTSGMDPEIRREIWELLLGLRGTRTILMTTHFMEEADALCDRIAIMDRGRIRCFGSPMFLKTKYGKGYVLSVVVHEAEEDKSVTDLIQRHIAGAKVKCQNIRTTSYQLPESEIENFSELLSELDGKQLRKEIVSYSICVATLEEVFLKLRDKSTSTDGLDTVDSPPYMKFVSPDAKSLTKVSDAWFYPNQLWALLVKKWILFLRTYRTYLVYTVLAFGLVAISSFSLNKRKPTAVIDTSTPLTFTTDLYEPFLLLFNSTDDFVTKAFQDYTAHAEYDVKQSDNIEDEFYKIFLRDFYEYARYADLGIVFSPSDITVLHNDEAIHMIPVAVNLLHNFLFKLDGVTGSIVTSVDARYVFKDDLYIPRSIPKCNLPSIPDFSGIQTFFYFLAPLKEDNLGAKEIQLMITTPSLYWLSHLLFDVLSLVPYLIIICLWFGLTQNNDYLIESLGEVSIALLLWGTGLILLGYVIAVIIRREMGTFTTSMITYMVFTFVVDNPITSFGLPNFLQYLHPSCIVKVGFDNLCSGRNNHYILSLILYNVVLYAFLVLYDSKVIPQIVHTLISKVVRVNYGAEKPPDQLVTEEKQLVEKLIKTNDMSGYALVVDNFKKWYMKSIKFSPAVRGISFTVCQGECFGLLGVNGAGKTSTFRMLTGSIAPSHGSAYVCPETMALCNRQKYLFQIGYCPQSGGLIPQLKGRELLKLIGRLRGISGRGLDVEVDHWLDKLSLLDFADEKCGTYSGGNQRKLSTAMSLIGGSPLVFLDEPTSGVDPASRRIMWNVVDDVQKEKRSVVLTSHSMDECEALCSRLAIMVEGRFCCLGEITTLKTRFGQGYCVQLKVTCDSSQNSIRSLKQSFLATFGSDCNLIDEHLTIIQYHVPKKNVSWSEVFMKLKLLKEHFDVIESYSASETTLEQIFIYMARNCGDDQLSQRE